MTKDQLLKIPVNSIYKDCKSRNCPFSEQCANHESAGEIRLDDGFTPEIFYDDETNEFFCKTAKVQSDKYQLCPWPVEYAGHGFVPIEAPKH